MLRSAFLLVVSKCVTSFNSYQLVNRELYMTPSNMYMIINWHYLHISWAYLTQWNRVLMRQSFKLDGGLIYFVQPDFNSSLQYKTLSNFHLTKLDNHMILQVQNFQVFCKSDVVLFLHHNMYARLHVHTQTVWLRYEMFYPVISSKYFSTQEYCFQSLHKMWTCIRSYIIPKPP